METTKISNNEIKVVETETTTKETTYSYDFLIKQKADIQAQKTREIEQRDAELLEVDTLIAEAEKLGIKAKPIIEEPIV